MKPNPNDPPPATVNKLRFIWVAPVAVVGLIVLVMMAGLKWDRWFADDESPKPVVRPAPKSVSGGRATEQKTVVPGIYGRVRLLGTPPPERTLPIDPASLFGPLRPMPFIKVPPPSEKFPATDPSWPKSHTTRFFVVGNQGELADVFIYIKSGLEGQSFAVPEQPVVLKTVGCAYEPYFAGVQTRQRLVVKNLDPFLHSVHTLPNVAGNREVSKAQLPGIDLEFAFEKPDIFIKLKCDVHPWEYGYVGVVEHPFFAVTDQAGAFALTNVPPGKYVIEAVHRRAGTQTREITLGANERQTADFVFDLKATAANPSAETRPALEPANPANALAEAPANAAAPAPPPVPTGAPAQTGTRQRVSGRARLQGIPPPEKLLPLDVSCGKLHSTQPTTRFYVVHEEGGLADVFVYIKSGLEGYRISVLSQQPVLLDQVGCEYTPYILGLQTRQKLLVRNSDPFLHNVHPTPAVAGNRESNRAQPPKGADFEYAFDQPELFLRFKCDVHPWMFAYVSVLDHPFFAVTDKAGAFVLPNLPPGKYVLEAVHRKAGTLTQEITIGAEEIQTADFVFEAKAGP